MLRTALLAGATGLVGRSCMERLLRDRDYQQVVAIGRRSARSAHPRLIELQVDFETLDEFNCPVRIDDAYCALGTTMRKAGSREEFSRVDLDYVKSFAAFAKKHGAKNFVLVSALGADPHAIGFYSRVKGLAEVAVREHGFEALHILRPSLIIGRREESRPAEAFGLLFARALSPVLIGPLRRARPVNTDQIAATMIAAAKSAASGSHLHYPSA